MVWLRCVIPLSDCAPVQDNTYDPCWEVYTLPGALSIAGLLYHRVPASSADDVAVARVPDLAFAKTRPRLKWITNSTFLYECKLCVLHKGSDAIHRFAICECDP